MAYISASINLTKLKETIISDPSLIAFKSKKGEAFVNVMIWINHEIDEFNNDCSIQLSTPKDHAKLEKAIYIGNGRTEKAFEEIERRKKLSEARIFTPKPEDKPTEETVSEFANVVTHDDLPF